MNRQTAAPMVLMAGVLCAPFIALWPIFQKNGEAMAPAFELWAGRLLWATIFAGIAAFIATRDAWLGAAVGLGVIDVLFRPTVLVGRSTIGIFALAALGLVWVRTWPADARRIAGHVLGVIGMLEALVMLVQLGGWNPLYGSWARTASVPMTGTMGNTAFASMLVAMTGAFGPWQLLPVLGLILWYAHSKIALLALALAAVIRLAPPKWSMPALLAALVVFAAGLWLTVSGEHRVWIWRQALARLTLLGDGLGLAPAIAAPHGSPAWDPEGTWRHVHNEMIQWARERGIVGAALLTGWLVTLRTQLTGSRAALAGCAALMFVANAQAPLHLIPTGLVAVVILGLASPSLLTSDPTGA